ncbi:hypothetical protein PQR69_33430 [Paraburkholderia megapolitana]
MNRILRNQVVCLSMVALTVASGCKRVDDNGKDVMSSGSSGVMSNSAGANGTAGDSDAAKRANRNAAASATYAPGIEAPVVSTPASAASQ